MFHAYGKDKGCRETRLELWIRIKDRSGKLTKELEAYPRISTEALWFWQQYLQVYKGCGGDVTYQTLDAYQRLMKQVLEPWQVELMVDIDKARCTCGR